MLMLGKLPARHDSRTLHFAKYRGLAGQAWPDTRDFSTAVKDLRMVYGMLLNDQLGDCAVAGPQHMVQTWRANAGSVYIPTDDDTLTAYKAISGYNPKYPDSDVGCCLVDVLNYWRKVGIGGHKIGAYNSVNPRNREEVIAAMNVGVGLLLGLQLPNCAEDQLASGVWDVSTDPVNGVPGSLGGHCVDGVFYTTVVGVTPAGLRVVTWGQEVVLTWAALAAWCDELYVIYSEDILNDQHVSPVGLDVATMLADIAALGNLPQQVMPATPPSLGKNLVLVISTGLFTDPVSSDDCGMLELAQRVAAAHPDYAPIYIRVGYDTKPPEPYTSGPDGLSRYVRDQVIAAHPTKIIWLGHSWGGAFAMFFSQWLAAWYSGPNHDNPPFSVDAFVLFDPVTNRLRFGEGQDSNWAAPLVVAPKQLCFYQTAGLIWFVEGTPLKVQGDTGQVTNVDVTDVRDPRLGHVDWGFPPLTGMINDTRPDGVQDQVMALAASVLV